MRGALLAAGELAGAVVGAIEQIYLSQGVSDSISSLCHRRSVEQ